MFIPNTVAFINGQEWIILLVVVLLFFGGAKIPQLMKGIGKGMGEFQTGLKEGKKKMDEAMKGTDDDDTPAAID